jgi:DNA polymerase (family 10)
MTNQEIAGKLLEQARLLSGRHENLYRVRAYRRAALAVQGLPVSVAELAADRGRRGLQAVPGIGSHLAYSIDHFARTGEWRTWDERGNKREATRKAG